MIDLKLLKKECSNFGIHLTAEQAELMDKFAEFLIFWNEKINLTAIVDSTEMIYKHFLDSLLIFNAIDLETGSKFLDVGAGAGFPSIPVSIVNDSLKITQLDSLKKRVDFLQQAKDLLNLNCVAVHGRAEEFAKNPNYRERFKYVSARAVARLNVLLEFCLPFVELGGFFIAMKGSQFEGELKNSENALKLLGGKVEKIKTFKFGGLNYRAIILIKKISHTSTKFPRNFSKILKFSL